MFNQFEQGTSCQQHIQTCFVTTGLNSEWGTDIGRLSSMSYDDVLLCPAVDTNPGNIFEFDAGWVKIAVSGLAGLDNNMGLFAFHRFGDSNFGRWFFGQ